MIRSNGRIDLTMNEDNLRQTIDATIDDVAPEGSIGETAELAQSAADAMRASIAAADQRARDAVRTAPNTNAGAAVLAADFHERLRAAGASMARSMQHLAMAGQLDTEPTPVSDAVMSRDLVDHPQHYTSHPSGIECIQVTEHAGFNVGNAIKYLWRTEWGEKGTDPVEDLRKAAWYIQREIDKLAKP